MKWSHLVAIHATSAVHRDEIEASSECGCFFCGSVFAPSEIARWIDEDPRGVGQTALCPRCGIDAVIGDGSGWILDGELMDEMNTAWFGPPSGTGSTFVAFDAFDEPADSSEFEPPTTRRVA